jgi:hypothetical protein
MSIDLTTRDSVRPDTIIQRGHSVRKSLRNGWEAKTVYDLPESRILTFSTTKNDRGEIFTSVCVSLLRPDGTTVTALYQDYYRVVRRDAARGTEKNIREAHTRNVNESLPAVCVAVCEQYGYREQLAPVDGTIVLTEEDDLQMAAIAAAKQEGELTAA